MSDTMNTTDLFKVRPDDVERIDWLNGGNVGNWAYLDDNGDLTLAPYRTVAYIEQSDIPFDPREEDYNLGTIATWHRNYQLGDEQPRCSPTEHMEELVGEYDPDFSERVERKAERFWAGRDIMSEDSMREWDEIYTQLLHDAFEKYYISLPVFMYEHSGIALSTGSFSCPWDSGQLGFIYVSIDRAKEEIGGGTWKYMTAKRVAQVERSLKAEVEEYDQCVRGHVWEYRVHPEYFHPDSPEDYIEGDYEDTCMGFIGGTLLHEVLFDVAGMWDSLYGNVEYVRYELDGFDLVSLEEEVKNHERRKQRKAA